MPTGTVHLHRVLRAKPEKIYRAFLDADAPGRAGNSGLKSPLPSHPKVRKVRKVA